MGTDEKIQVKAAKPKSLGARLVTARFHERLQFERYPIHDFVRREGIPQLEPDDKVPDAGSGRLPEQHLHEEILVAGASLTTLYLFAGEGLMPFDDGYFCGILYTVSKRRAQFRRNCQELSGA